MMKCLEIYFQTFVLESKPTFPFINYYSRTELIKVYKSGHPKRTLSKQRQNNVTQCDTIKKGYIFMKWVFGASISLNKYLVIG